MFMRNPRLVAEAEQKILEGVKNPLQRRVLAGVMAGANEQAEIEDNKRVKEAYERLKRGDVRRA